jgi:hypothetical protein
VNAYPQSAARLLNPAFAGAGVFVANTDAVTCFECLVPSGTTMNGSRRRKGGTCVAHERVFFNTDARTFPGEHTRARLRAVRALTPKKGATIELL